MLITTIQLIPYILVCAIQCLCIPNIHIGPTHVYHDGSTSTIDLVFTPNPSIVSNSETVPPLANSDHYGVLLELTKKPDKVEKSHSRLVWRYSLANWSRACELIEAFDWDSILTDNIDLSWERWHHQFMNIMKQTIPNKLLPSRRNLPWMNKPITRCIKKGTCFLSRQRKVVTFAVTKLLGTGLQP